VPSLGELELSCGPLWDRLPFKLSEILYGTTCIDTLTLDFQGENVSYSLFLLSSHILFCICSVVTAILDHRE
jgi:hypothetical protein